MLILIKQFKQMLDKIKSTYGTNFEIIFNYVAKSNIKPLALLIITDGYAKCPENILNQTDVIWILTDDISGKKKLETYLYIKGDYIKMTYKQFREEIKKMKEKRVK